MIEIITRLMENLGLDLSDINTFLLGAILCATGAIADSILVGWVVSVWMIVWIISYSEEIIRDVCMFMSGVLISSAVCAFMFDVAKG